MRIAKQQTWLKWSIAAYLLLIHVILPLLSPLRALGVLEPGEIRNAILPPLLLITVLSAGMVSVLRPRTFLHIILFVFLLNALIIGIPHLLDPTSVRYYFSHGFQLISAYILLSVGWLAKDIFSEKFWKYFAIASLVTTFIASYYTLSAYGKGEIGRLYTPAYGFILIFSYGILKSRSISGLAALGTLISNKRGVIISLIAIILTRLITSISTAGSKSLRKITAGIAGFLIIATIAIGAVSGLVHWSSQIENEANPLAKAVTTTYVRLNDMFTYQEQNRSLDEMSSGRLEEVDSATKSINAFSVVFGSGAGWSATLDGGGIIQNIHFTPLSLTVVYGGIFTILLYSYLGYLVLLGSKGRDENTLNTTEKLAPLYLSAAIIHSLTAYSLFIDWLVFFFAGVLIRSLKTKTTSLPNPSRDSN